MGKENEEKKIEKKQLVNEKSERRDERNKQ
jgi:hypothetical protein